MKILRLKLSKTRSAPRDTSKRWIAAAIGTASLADITLFDRRSSGRPRALTGPASTRTRHARTA